MNTSALVLMLTTMLLVTGMTSYFFIKVLISPHKPASDPFEEDEEEVMRKRS